MGIDLESIKQGFSTLGMALTTLKQVKELFPENPKAKDVDQALEQAERQLKLAESQVAQGLGYELCRNHFPPEAMLSPDNHQWRCPKCQNERNTITSFGISYL